MPSRLLKLRGWEGERDVRRKGKKKPGLWENIRKKRASGRPMAKKGSKAYKKAVAAGKKINAAAKRRKRKTKR